MSFWCLQIFQKPTNFFPGFLPQPLKRGQINLFFEAGAEILKTISLVFWSKWWHQKDISKLTDLYLSTKKDIYLPKCHWRSALYVLYATVFSVWNLTKYVVSTLVLKIKNPTLKMIPPYYADCHLSASFLSSKLSKKIKMKTPFFVFMLNQPIFTRNC